MTRIPLTVDTAGCLWFDDSLINPGDIQGTQLANGTLTTTQIASNAGILPTQLSAGVTKVLTGKVTYKDGKSANPIITIPANSLVTNVIAVCTTAFNGTAVTIDLGDNSLSNNFIANTNVGITLNAVSGTNPSLCGSNLWQAGGQSTTAGNWTATFPTITTPDNWEVINKDTGTTLSAAELPFTQTTTTTVISAGSQTKTPSNFGVTTWGSPLTAFYAAANNLNSTLGYTGTSKGTAGAMTVYLVYVALA